jgi:hypothetical protein
MKLWGSRLTVRQSFSFYLFLVFTATFKSLSGVNEEKYEKHVEIVGLRPDKPILIQGLPNLKQKYELPPHRSDRRNAN